MCSYCTLSHTDSVFGSFEMSIPLVSIGIQSYEVLRDLDLANLLRMICHIRESILCSWLYSSSFCGINIPSESILNSFMLVQLVKCHLKLTCVQHLQFFSRGNHPLKIGRVQRSIPQCLCMASVPLSLRTYLTVCALSKNVILIASLTFSSS